MNLKVTVAAALLLSACMNRQTITPIDFAKISDVQADIKRQIAVYVRARKTLPTSLSTNPSDYWCGRGDIDFDVASVKADLQTSLDNTFGGSLGITFPVGALGSVGPSAGLTDETKATQDLTFTEWPLPHQDQLNSMPPPTVDELASAPIAVAILALRAALVQAALKVDPVSHKARNPQACFTVFDPTKPGDPSAHSFQLGITDTKDMNGGVEVKLAVLDAKLTADSKAALGSSLTVTFAQTDAMARDKLLKACTTNAKSSALCPGILAGDWSGYGKGIGLQWQ